MVRLNGLDIELTRGDSLLFSARVSGRELPEGTLLLFSVKKNPRQEEALIEKREAVEDAGAVFSLSPRETDLPARTYFWDIRVLIPYGDGTYEVRTPMEYAAFQVTEVIGNV